MLKAVQRNLPLTRAARTLRTSFYRAFTYTQVRATRHLYGVVRLLFDSTQYPPLYLCLRDLFIHHAGRRLISIRYIPNTLATNTPVHLP